MLLGRSVPLMHRELARGLPIRHERRDLLGEGMALELAGRDRRRHLGALLVKLHHLVVVH